MTSFQLDGTRFRLYQAANDPAPIRERGGPEPTSGQPPSEDDLTDSEFAYEQDLRGYLAKNLHLIEPGLRLYSDEGVSGVEFPAGGRFIDILSVDSSGGYVVVQLKVSRGYDRVVGQLLRYWVGLSGTKPIQANRCAA